MTNILGGGGGKEGFRHLLEHIAPGAQLWIKDMNAHAFPYDSDGLERLSNSVQEWLAVVDAGKVEEQRDRVLLELIRLKRQESALI